MALMGDLVQQYPRFQATRSKDRAHIGPDLFSHLQLAIRRASRLSRPAPPSWKKGHSRQSHSLSLDVCICSPLRVSQQPQSSDTLGPKS